MHSKYIMFDYMWLRFWNLSCSLLLCHYITNWENIPEDFEILYFFNILSTTTP